MPSKHFLHVDLGAVAEILRCLDRGEQLQVLELLDRIEVARRLPASAEVVVRDFKGARLSVVPISELRLYFVERQGSASLNHLVRSCHPLQAGEPAGSLRDRILPSL
jgi:hypothetical protein